MALTFTDKSANEMVERVDKMVEMGYVDPQNLHFSFFLPAPAIERGLCAGHRPTQSI